jgi:tetratricopeptide (TPR) repeat protein
MQRRLIVIFTTFIFWYLYSPVTLAKTKKPEDLDKFLPSPLEIVTPDPLIRTTVNQQPLTVEEMQTLETALDELNLAAAATLREGTQKAAFDIWNREIRLRRYLGNVAEVQALSRVGAIAWNENAREEVRYITERLQAIQKQTTKQKSIDLALWKSLGDAYQKVRTPKLALEAYQQILALVRQQQDKTAEIETLTTIGELHLIWFDYPQAIATYEELLNLATANSDRLNRLTYLQKLAYIYEQAKQPQQSINTRKKLIEIYITEDNINQIPPLKLAIAADYETLAKENPSLLAEAFNNYQTAYTTAWQLQQFVTAGEALEKLIALYSSQGQIEAALQTSEILIETEKLGSNYYGLMQAYDKLGKLYLERKDYPQALTAFQNGLEIAQQLKHQETYFIQQIEKLPK